MRENISAHLKLARAREHLDKLQQQVRFFLESDPVTITCKDDIEKGRYIFRFECIIPSDIPIRVGELAYTLRSCLSHLAWHLALLEKDNPSRATDFPIHCDQSHGSKKRFRKVTSELPPEAVKIIKSLQPYAGLDGFGQHPLWRLNRLCNIDKHATLAVNSAGLNFTPFFFPPFGPSDVTIDEHRLDDCTELHITPIEAKDYVKIKKSRPILIFGRPINDPGPLFEITLNDIVEIDEFVRNEVVPRFEIFFV